VAAQISPDGGTVLFQVSRPRTGDEKPGRALNEIWIAPAEAGATPFRFTASEAGDRSPQWSPDGRRIAFISTRPGLEEAQVYLIHPDGGEAWPLTRAEGGVSSFRWSPDGRRIAYTMTDPLAKAQREAQQQGRAWIVADREYRHTRLYAIDVETGDSGLLTKADLTIHDFDWSPDGGQLLVLAAPTPTVDDSFMRVQMMLVDAVGGEPRLLVKTEGKLTHPRWSPDGRWIAWLGATALNDPFAGSVFVIPTAGGAPQHLTPDYEGTANWLGWRPGAPATIVFGAVERQATVLHTIAPGDRARRPLQAGGLSFLTGPSFAADGSRLAIVANTPAHPNEVFTGPTEGELGRVTALNPQLADVALGAQEIVRWRSVDGWEIEGVLVKPVGYEAGRRYPLIMQPHGGPEAADLQGWLGTYSRWGQMLAGRGYLTFYPNYRGSIGRGVAFARGDQRDLMGKEFEDMLAGIDYLVREGLADPDRVGVGGGSYGGYTSAWAATHGSERFKAAVMWMGVSNWISFTGTADIFWENSIVHWDAIMYENDNYGLYWERSPLKHIQKANTPTLIIHGADDTRVPIGQSREMYTALRWKGVPVEFVTYPREGHGVAERAHQEDFMNRVLGWFEKYVRELEAEKTAGR
jgi:dipeptidyl aminopeptidase/acylaminoacyl peptidase